VFDSHCHLDAPEFDADRAQVLARARAAGVHTLVLPAIRAADFASLADMCASDVNLAFALGLHPICLSEHRAEHLTELANYLRDGINGQRACAVGECGLDYFLPDMDVEQQMFYFEAQLRLAREFDLPVIVHARRAHDAVIHGLRRFGISKGVVHSFAGSAEQAKALFKMGIHLGIGGPVSYPRAQRLRSIVQNMPIEYLLLETDAPDQPLMGRQGARNEPAYLTEVASCIAQLRGVALAELVELTDANSAKLFHPQGNASA
jgi:TatD DNase family protein